MLKWNLNLTKNIVCFSSGVRVERWIVLPLKKKYEEILRNLHFSVATSLRSIKVSRFSTLYIKQGHRYLVSIK